MSEPSVYNVEPVVSFSGRPSFKVKAHSPEQAEQFVEAKLTEFPSDFAEEAFQQIRNEQLNGGFSAQLGDHVEVKDWGAVSDARNPNSIPDATGFEIPMEEWTKEDLKPKTRDVGHAVYTGLTGEEDRYARENLPIFYLGMLQGSNRIVAAESNEVAAELLSQGAFSEYRAVAAESLEAARDRYKWATHQYMATIGSTSENTDELLAEKGYDSYDEAVQAEGPHKVSEGDIDIRSTNFVGVQHTYDDSVEIVSEDDSVYTVVGTSLHHPDGFIRRVEAGSADEAREIVDDGDETILAVFEGNHDSL